MFPLTIYSAFSLKWSKSVNDDAELLLAIKEGLGLSPIGELLIRSTETPVKRSEKGIKWIDETFY